MLIMMKGKTLETVRYVPRYYQIVLIYVSYILSLIFSSQFGVNKFYSLKFGIPHSDWSEATFKNIWCIVVLLIAGAQTLSLTVLGPHVLSLI